MRALQGVVAEQPAPTVTVPLASTAAKSPSWAAMLAPDPFPAVSSVHRFGAVHAYKLAPAGAALLK